MYIEAGHELYGKVDQVPGLFHVATKFFHLYYIRLIPTGTFLVDERTQPPREWPIPWSSRSMLFGWLRVALMLSAVGLLVTAFVLLLMLGQGEPVGHKLVIAVVCSAVFGGVLYRSYRLTRAKPLRALELARVIGVPPEQLAHYFLDYEDLPDPNDVAQSGESSEIQANTYSSNAG
jgi:hypothetical protein